MKKITLKKVSLTILTLLLTVAMFSQTTIDIPVTAAAADSGDDAEEDVGSGDVVLDSTDLEFYNDEDDTPNNQLVGIRFQGVTVPQGANITTAYIQFEVDESETGSVTIDIVGIDVDDAVQFTNTDYDISDRIDGDISSGTTATVSWSPPDWGTVGANGADQRTSDVSAIVKEIVDRAGWSSGNDMAFVFTGNSGSPNRRTAEDGDDTNGPVLHIEYTLTPEIDITGNSVSIADGDVTPDVTDDTQFGSVGTGETLDRTFTITNLGGATLNLSGSPRVAISGDTEFTVLTQPSASSITGVGSLNFVVRFSPGATSTYNATISVDNDDSDENPYTFNIQGTGVVGATEINVTGNNVSITDGDATPDVADDTDFGSVVVASSLTKTFTIENTGTANLSISSVTSSDANFVIISSPASTVTIGGSTPFEVQFTPSGLGLDSSTITIVNDDSDENPYTFNIQGLGIATPPYPSVIVAGDVDWNYLDDGSDQGDAGAGWTAIAFDDSTWETGQAELGYGDGDEATDIGQPAEPRPYTTYFRKYVGITDASAFNSIDLGAIRDDAMVVYLNGTEIWRDNISADPVAFDDPSDDDVASSPLGGETSWIYTNVASTALVNGTNVIAVEIHQRTTGSSDISFDFEFTPSVVAPGATQVQRGPYLQSGTSNSVIVKWRTDISTNTIVNYGTTLGSLSSTVSSGVLVTNHEITLTGLSANTTYFYEIEDASGVYVAEDSQMYVKTDPNPGTQQFVRAWILGDAGTGNGDQRNVRDQYYSYIAGASTAPNQSDMMLFLGDNAYDNGTDNEYQGGLFDIYGDMLKKSVAWSTIGNHDAISITDPDTQSGIYFDIFSFPTDTGATGNLSGTEAYYSFDYANIHFIVLDSQHYSSDATQMAWCTADIAATTQDWIVALFHHPPYTYSNTHNSDSESRLVNMRNNFLPILEAGGVDLVLNGHSHLFERTFFINGHTGLSNTFNIAEIGSGGHTVGVTGAGDGKIGSDGAYTRASLANPEGAVYVTTGSAGKTNPAVAHRAHHYISTSSLGSCVLEVESDGGDGQNLTVKFIRETGAIDDEFTINKAGISIVASTPNESIDNDVIMVYPVPTYDILNIKIRNEEILQKVTFYNAIGAVAKRSNKEVIDVSNLKTGVYMIEITTNQKSYFKTIIIE